MQNCALSWTPAFTVAHQAESSKGGGATEFTISDDESGLKELWASDLMT